jgi:hypothetical protein
VSLSRRQLLIALGIATVAFYVALFVIDLRLRATGGPSILGLEFAGSGQRAAEILVEWGDHGQNLARASLWLDFGFMLSYGAFFALAAVATRDFARENGLRALAAAGEVAPARPGRGLARAMLGAMASVRTKRIYTRRRRMTAGWC